MIWRAGTVSWILTLHAINLDLTHMVPNTLPGVMQSQELPLSFTGCDSKNNNKIVVMNYGDLPYGAREMTQRAGALNELGPSLVPYT